MSSVLNFFCKNVAAVDFARDVRDGGLAADLDDLADLVRAEVDMLGAFVGDGRGPVDGGLTVVVNWGGCENIHHAQIGGAVANMQKFGDAFVRGNDLGLTRTLRRLLLADGLPGDGTAASTDEEAGEGAKFKKLNRGAIGN